MMIPHISVIIWMIATIISSLGLVIFLGSNNRSSRLFSLNSFLVSAWSVSVSFIPILRDSNSENLLLRFTFLMGIVIGSFFLVFSNIFPDNQRIDKRVIKLLLLVIVIFSMLLFLSDLVIGKSFVVAGTWHWGQNYGPLWFLFDFLFASLWIIGIRTLTRKLANTNDHISKINIKLMLVGLIIGVIPPTIFSIILPRLGIFSLNWIGPASGIIWVIIVAYSIIRYNQMNVRVVITQVLAIAMSAIFFINIFVDASFGLVSRLVTFLSFIILAYFLLRGIVIESRQATELNDLNKNLEAKVQQQTAEIRQSLESERHARVELEKLNEAKNQFILMTQHHLRTPLTSMMWTLEESLDGTHGKMTKKASSALNTAKKAGERLKKIIDDFLEISTIKSGSSILNISKSSFKSIFEDILSELDSQIKEMNVSIKFDPPLNKWPIIDMDQSKMRECLYIIVENAIKYNVKGGSILIETHSENNFLEISISNTGIGISAEETEKIGSALFYRSEYARKAYPIGMGVGLSVARAIVNAHHGTFTISSEGRDKGAKVDIKMAFK